MLKNINLKILIALTIGLSNIILYTSCYPEDKSISSTQLKTNPDAMKGFILGLHSKDYSYDYFPLIEEIKNTGAEWIGINFKVFQDCSSSSFINYPEKGGAYWKQINQTVEQAKSLNLNVMLLPIVLIENPIDKEWRGVLSPYSKKLWYESYSELYSIIAQISEKNKVDLLSIGSEFNSLQIDTENWKNVIRKIKKEYQGKITYSCNWDVINDIHFTNELDIMGITGYNSLTERNDPSLGELQVAWNEIKKEILKVQTEKNIPIFFTEVGYTSQDGTNKDPWNYHISNTLDLEEQYDCYLTFINTWKNEPEFQGVFFYDWFGVGGTKDTGYTLRGKPALSLVEQWFSEQEKEVQ